RRGRARHRALARRVGATGGVGFASGARVSQVPTGAFGPRGELLSVGSRFGRGDHFRSARRCASFDWLRGAGSLAADCRLAGSCRRNRHGLSSAGTVVHVANAGAKRPSARIRARPLLCTMRVLLGFLNLECKMKLEIWMAFVVGALLSWGVYVPI